MKYMLAFLSLFAGTICIVNADNNKTEDLNKSADTILHSARKKRIVIEPELHRH